MDDKNIKESSSLGNETKKKGRQEILLQSVNRKIPEPSKIKQWYIDYILSDFTFASLSTAILLMIKVYFNIGWEKFWSGLILWYVVYIATMIARVVKTISEHYKVKK